MKHTIHSTAWHHSLSLLPLRNLAAVLFLIILFCGCSQRDGTHFEHKEKNSVYYWKTVFVPDSADYVFFRKHDIQRIYMRMFDVSVDTENKADHAHTYPNATMRIPDDTFSQLKDSFPDMEYVPVVYITLNALKDGQVFGIGDLARNIVIRVKNMCSYNEFTHVGGLQLDCDWTQTTEQPFFDLCDSVRAQIKKLELSWSISSTIRLHQLARRVPPVDYGVLMVYNTGNFNDPDADNSILSEKDAQPYLKYLEKYPLHLDVAYPTYSWQLLFRDRRFVGLLNGVEVGDTAKFSPRTMNTHIALTDIPYRETVIYKGDIIRTEQSDFHTIKSVKELIESYLNDKPHSSILYHFELKNLLKYSDNEIAYLFNTVPSK